MVLSPLITTHDLLRPVTTFYDSLHSRHIGRLSLQCVCFRSNFIVSSEHHRQSRIAPAIYERNATNATSRQPNQPRKIDQISRHLIDTCGVVNESRLTCH